MTNVAELRLIREIADRAVVLYRRLDAVEPKNEGFMRSGVAYELRLVHEEVIPLRLAEMLVADEDNFAHDIAGIHRHLEHGARTQGPYFSEGFSPRFGVANVSNLENER
jgi:hypothetical protein